MKPDQTTYRGERWGGGGGDVRVTVAADPAAPSTAWRELSPAKSQRVRNHSLTGFEWGYGGSGPAQLALALLLDFTSSRELAERHYQAFKWSIVAGFDHQSWQLDGGQVRQWLAAAELAERTDQAGAEDLDA